jgi:hypothetical protein
MVVPGDCQAGMPTFASGDGLPARTSFTPTNNSGRCSSSCATARSRRSIGDNVMSFTEPFASWPCCRNVVRRSASPAGPPAYSSEIRAARASRTSAGTHGSCSQVTAPPSPRNRHMHRQNPPVTNSSRTPNPRGRSASTVRGGQQQARFFARPTPITVSSPSGPPATVFLHDRHGGLAAMTPSGC